MSRTEDIATDMRESVFDSRPAEFIAGLTPLRAVIGLGVGLMGLGMVLLVLTTLSVIAANVTPLRPLYAGLGSVALSIEGFAVTILCAEFLD
jgi:hypothetical protein